MWLLASAVSPVMCIVRSPPHNAHLMLKLYAKSNCRGDFHYSGMDHSNNPKYSISRHGIKRGRLGDLTLGICAGTTILQNAVATSCPIRGLGVHTLLLPASVC